MLMSPDPFLSLGLVRVAATPDHLMAGARPYRLAVYVIYHPSQRAKVINYILPRYYNNKSGNVYIATSSARR